MGFFIYTLSIIFLLYAIAIGSHNRKYRLSRDDIRINEDLKPSVIIILFSASIIYILIRTFHYNTGVDYMAYYQFYMACVNHAFDYWGSSKEVGFIYLVQQLSKISSSPSLFFFVCASFQLASLLLMAKFLKRAAPYFVTIWFVFMFNLSMNLYRQYIALGFCMIFVCFLLKYGFKRYIVLTIVALCSFLFHKSSLIGIGLILLIYIGRKVYISKWILIGMAVLTSMTSYTLITILGSEYGYISDVLMSKMDHNYYFDEITESYFDESRLTYLNMVVYAILIYYAERVMRKNSKTQFLFYILAFAFIFEPITRQEILMRMRLYLTSIMTIGYGVMLYYYFRQRVQKKYMLLYVVVLYQVVYYFVYSNMTLLKEFPLQVSV